MISVSTSRLAAWFGGLVFVALAAALIAAPGHVSADTAARALPPPTADVASAGPDLQTAVFAGGCFGASRACFSTSKA